MLCHFVFNVFRKWFPASKYRCALKLIQVLKVRLLLSACDTFSLDYKLMGPNANLNNVTRYLAGASIGKERWIMNVVVKRPSNKIQFDQRQERFSIVQWAWLKTKMLLQNDKMSWPSMHHSCIMGSILRLILIPSSKEWHPKLGSERSFH
jgi:hypothetical protein